MISTFPGDLLHRLVTEDGPRPLITYYDDGSGERTELSAITFDNWVAKTANLLVDEFGAGPGDAVALLLPPHWQTAIWLFAVWSAGLVAVPAAPLDHGAYADCTILATTAAGLAAARESPAARAGAEIVGLSLHPLGGGLTDCPPGVTDYAIAVRAHGDRFTGAAEFPGPCLRCPMEPPRTGADLLTMARGFSATFHLTKRDRLYTETSYDTTDGLVSGLLGPFVAGSAVMLCSQVDMSRISDRLAAERITGRVLRMTENYSVQRPA